ncbi:hypothetical protein CW306_14215 [Bacillus sp. BA3]|nr:hypothetical protein CW306_14215 [Bacillus sp. BA3]
MKKELAFFAGSSFVIKINAYLSRSGGPGYRMNGLNCRENEKNNFISKNYCLNYTNHDIIKSVVTIEQAINKLQMLSSHHAKKHFIRTSH